MIRTREIDSLLHVRLFKIWMFLVSKATTPSPVLNRQTSTTSSPLSHTTYNFIKHESLV